MPRSVLRPLQIGILIVISDLGSRMSILKQITEGRPDLVFDYLSAGHQDQFISSPGDRAGRLVFWRHHCGWTCDGLPPVYMFKLKAQSEEWVES